MFSKRQKKRRNFFRKAQIAPYKARRFQNPYFRSNKQLPAWPLIVAGLSLGLAVALSSFFLTAPVFTISSVRVEGAETINPKEIRTIAEDYLAERSFLFFKNSNRFFFNEEKLQTLLEKKYSFSSLIIERENQTVAIILQEKISSFLWISGNSFSLLDNSGSVIRSTAPEETEAILNPPLIEGPTKTGGLIPETVRILVFRDLAGESVTIGDVVMTESEVSKIRSFFEAMYSAGIVIEKFELNRGVGSWLKAITREGYDILFDPNEDVLRQADNIFLLLREQIKDTSNLEYIDVRFGDHVYYK